MSGRKSKVQQAIEDAMADRGMITTPVELPDRINGKKPKLRAVRDHLIMVQESKPVEFLMHLMTTGACDFKSVDEDGIVTDHVIPLKPSERIKIAQFLANKLMPSMQVIKVINETTEPDAQKNGFEALVDRAIDRSRTQ